MTPQHGFLQRASTHLANRRTGESLLCPSVKLLARPPRMRLRRRLNRSSSLPPATQHCRHPRLWASGLPLPNVPYLLSSRRLRTSSGLHLLLAPLLPLPPLPLFIRPPILACRLLIQRPPNYIITLMTCRVAILLITPLMRNLHASPYKCPCHPAGLRSPCSLRHPSYTTLPRLILYR